MEGAHTLSTLPKPFRSIMNLTSNPGGMSHFTARCASRGWDNVLHNDASDAGGQMGGKR